jgi:glycosyltransferase involved in cell wall biosynthesis
MVESISHEPQEISISVIVPTRNRAAHLKRLLDAMLAEDYSRKEIIVFDGASTDGTVELLRSYGNEVRWVSEPDSGEYDARNKALRLAAGDVIKYMSDDDVMMPGTFGIAAEFFRKNPHVDLLFGQSVWFDDRVDGEHTVCDTRKRDANSITLKNFIRQSGPLPNSETAFFRRRVIDKIGYFDCSRRGADYEYWARAAKAGCQIRISDEVFLHYHLSDLSGVERNNIKMVFELWGITKQYGDWTDKVYVAVFLIPFRLVVRGLVNYAPIFGRPARRLWGRWKTRDSLH